MSSYLSQSRAFSLAFVAAIASVVVAGQDAANQSSGKPQGGKQASAKEPADEQADKGQQKKEKEPKQLQVFQLKHSKPQEMVTLLSTIMAAKSDQRTPNYPGPVPTGFAAYSPGSTTLGGDIRIAIDNTSKNLFIRAPKSKLDQIKEIVTAFDVPLDKMPTNELNGKVLAPMPNDKANRVAVLFRQLEFEVATINLGENQLLVFDVSQEGIGEQVKQILSAVESSGEAHAESGDANADAAKGEKSKQKAAESNDAR